MNSRASRFRQVTDTPLSGTRAGPCSGRSASRLLDAVVRVAALLALLLGAGCQDGGPATKPAPLRLGVLPGQAAVSQRARLAPLCDYLSATIGRPCELRVSNSYAELVDLFANEELDLALFGGVTFLLAEDRVDAQPLVLRDADLRFTSSLIVRDDDPAESLGDLSGSTLAFGSRLSTSGHLMPRHFLLEEGVAPEAFFGSIVYSDAHDRTLRWVLAGRVRAGVVNSDVVRRLMGTEVSNAGGVRVLWETPPYTDYVWTVPTTMNPALRSELRDAFLALSIDDPEHAAILEELEAHQFLPATRHDFEELREVYGVMNEWLGESALGGTR